VSRPGAESGPRASPRRGGAAQRFAGKPPGDPFEAKTGEAPLAAKMRPRTLDEIVGQRHLLAPGKWLRGAIERRRLTSMILWGPPGSGKTTLARVLAQAMQAEFVPFSAVSEGVPRIRQIVAEAVERRSAHGRATIVFVDEIHRLNKAQQDSLLPPAEDGTFVLIGATTENPSFALNRALLSRTRVFVLEPLGVDDIVVLLRRALEDSERGLGALAIESDDTILVAIASAVDGDARRALTVLEAAAAHAGERGRITHEIVREALQQRYSPHDHDGDHHFDLLSAYHKSLRGSDPQAALYWMARMIQAGEDPLVLFRRAIAMAAEDIGVADPHALQLAVAARDAYQMLGQPEGLLPLAEMTIYLATAPKSNATYRALHAAMETAGQTPGTPVPLHLRNAPTGLMRELGFGKDYRYPHDFPGSYVPQDYLPDGLPRTHFFEPGDAGYEATIAQRMRRWAAASPDPATVANEPHGQARNVHGGRTAPADQPRVADGLDDEA